MKALIAMILLALFIGAPAHGQWEQAADPSISRNSSGEPELTGSTPKAVDGKPDLSGVWIATADLIPQGFELVEGELPLPRHMLNVMSDLEPGEVEMKPWAAELVAERQASRGLADPVAYCKPWGVTQLAANLTPYKIVQTPDLVLILNEQDTVFRQIFLDGRKPVDDPLPRWLGYSSGQWVDDVLVVETTGFTDQTWLDFSGHPHTESMRLTERFRRPDAGHLQIEITIDDAETYSQKFTYTVTAGLMPDDDLLEFFCTDNEISSAHYQ